MREETSERQPPAPKAEPAPPTEAELSRMAREAVHQPPDARLDKQLARMGLIDASESAETQPARATGRPVERDAELEGLRDELRRTRTILWVVAAIAAVLAIVVVVLLVS